MPTVENAAYKLPSEYQILYGSSRLKADLTEQQGPLQDLPQVAREMGFVKSGNLDTKKATWEVYHRPQHPVPNFPEGDTIINSSLALYEMGGDLTRAILRTSIKPYPAEKFIKDLDAFTKYYVERPRLLGFPSQELTRMRGIAASLVVGSVLLSAIDYYTIQTIQGSIINPGTIIGEIGGPVAYGTLWALSERYARRHISALDQYTAGNNVRDILHSERYHTIQVGIQRNLYFALKQEDINLNPEQFLNKIYKQLPSDLLYKRQAEIEQAKYPGQYVPAETGNTQPKLMEIAHILQTA